MYTQYSFTTIVLASLYIINLFTLFAFQKKFCVLIVGQYIHPDPFQHYNHLVQPLFSLIELQKLYFYNLNIHYILYWNYVPTYICKVCSKKCNCIINHHCCSSMHNHNILFLIYHISKQQVYIITLIHCNLFILFILIFDLTNRIGRLAF